MSIIVWNESYCPIQNHILKKQTTFWLNFICFPVFKNSIRKRVWIVNNFLAFFICQRPCRISILYAHFLSEVACTCLDFFLHYYPPHSLPWFLLKAALRGKNRVWFHNVPAKTFGYKVIICILHYMYLEWKLVNINFLF